MTVKERNGRMRVGVLGCGSVGGGVIERLLAYPDRFALAPVLVRDLAKPGRPAGARYTTDVEAVFAAEPDLLIEVMGGPDGATEVMERAMATGAHVVTANKAAVAKHYDRLHRAAARAEVRFAYSAAVGGGAPILETVADLRCDRALGHIEGVMNGTANFLLDRLAEGADFDAAVRDAQDKGFAEADPTADVDGHDAADKLSILMRAAFDLARAPQDIPKESLRDLSAADVRTARDRGVVYKQIGRAHIAQDGLCAASVRIETVPLDHPFADARNEDNRFEIRCIDGGVTRVAGKGAGREPTAGAVMADVARILAHRPVTPAL